MKDFLYKRIEDRFMPSVASLPDYIKEATSENTRRTIMFAKVVSILVVVLIMIMTWRYQGSDLIHFLIVEPYSRLFFCYLIASVGLVLLSKLPLKHDNAAFFYRVTLLILCAIQAAMDLALYDSMVIFLIVLQTIAALISMRVRNLVIFFPGAAVLFAFFAQYQIQTLSINHYLQIVVVTLISCVIGLEFERQRRRRFTLNQNLQAAFEKAEQAARTDYLTGVFNRKAIFEFGHSLLAQTKRYRDSGSLIYVDLDNFKLINDEFGHAAGDEVIKRTSELFVAMTRESDAVGRIGGEEFVLILPNTKPRAAASFAKRLFTEVRATQIENDGQVIRITFSAGISEFKESDENFESVLARADQGLYAAKNTGRDRWVYVSE